MASALGAGPRRTAAWPAARSPWRWGPRPSAARRARTGPFRQAGDFIRPSLSFLPDGCLTVAREGRANAAPHTAQKAVPPRCRGKRGAGGPSVVSHLRRNEVPIKETGLSTVRCPPTSGAGPGPRACAVDLLCGALLFVVDGVEDQQAAGQRGDCPLQERQVTLRCVGVDGVFDGLFRVFGTVGGGKLELLAQYATVGRGSQRRSGQDRLGQRRGCHALLGHNPGGIHREQAAAADQVSADRRRIHRLPLRPAARRNPGGGLPVPPSARAAPFSPTAPIREPPNYAASPTSCKLRSTVLRSDISQLLERRRRASADLQMPMLVTLQPTRLPHSGQALRRRYRSDAPTTPSTKDSSPASGAQLLQPGCQTPRDRHLTGPGLRRPRPSVARRRGALRPRTGHRGRRSAARRRSHVRSWVRVTQDGRRRSRTRVGACAYGTNGLLRERSTGRSEGAGLDQGAPGCGVLQCR